MNWSARIQIFFWLAGTVASIVTTVSIIRALQQYRRSNRQRVAESLTALEERLQAHWRIMALLDPASGRYTAELRPAVQESLDKIPPGKRQPEHKELIIQLDQFLRFLLLLSSLEKYELLNREALEYMYEYWFAAVYPDNEHLRAYIKNYYPKLNTWLSQKYQLPR
jgi:hypothetical protein